MNDRTVTVFGGTGFLGRRVVRHLRKAGFPCGLHQDIRNGATRCSVVMIRNFNRSKPTFWQEASREFVNQIGIAHPYHLENGEISTQAHKAGSIPALSQGDVRFGSQADIATQRDVRMNGKRY